jgi:hypothetical protein
MISIGSQCGITHDIVVEGQVAFKAGETVIVEGVSPNPQRPEYMYVVTSSTLNRKFQLSDQDLLTSAPAYQTPPQSVLTQPQASFGAAPPGPAGYQPPNESSAVTALVLGILSFFLCPLIFGVLAIVLGKSSEKKIDQSGGRLGGRGMAQAGVICGVINIVLAVIVGVIVLIAVPVFTSATNSAQVRTCQSNLRTIDSSVNAYNGFYDAWPPAGPVDDVLGPTWLKRNPTCPTSGESYTLTSPAGLNEPPTTECPTNEPGHTI